MPKIRDQTYELVRVEALAPHPDNPRQGNVEAIAESVTQNGFYGAIVAQRSTGYILAGNHRLLAARQQGLAEVPVVWLDVDDDWARRILADNRTNDLATYDQEQLAALLGELAVTESGLIGTGYSAEDLAALAGKPQPRDDDGDANVAPETPEEPILKPGDVWMLGEHRLLVGDATDVAAVEAMLDGDRADCMWTDPPYGVSYVGKTKDALRIENDGSENLYELLAGALAVATVVLKPGSPFYLAHADTARSLFEHAVRQAGWAVRQNLVWVKDVMVLGHSDYHWRHEPILYGFTAGGEGRKGRGGDRWFGANNATTVLEFPKPSRSSEHPTMKPVELVEACFAKLLSTWRGGVRAVRRIRIHPDRRGTARREGTGGGGGPAVRRRDLPPLAGALR
jgi:hypothetical protein